jgi:hypothetical protein
MSESLTNARAKLGSLLEIYAPLGLGRENAMEVMRASLVEFEAAVREDERAATAASVAILEAQTKALNASAAAASAHGFQKDDPVEHPLAVAPAPLDGLTGSGDALTVPEDQDRAAVEQDQAPPPVEVEIPGVNAPPARRGRVRGG